jgi:hypothetical protein
LPDDHLSTAIKLQRSFNKSRAALAEKYGTPPGNDNA